MSPLLEDVHRLAHLGELLGGEVAAHAAEGVDAVVDAVAGEAGQDVHDQLAVAPRVHEQRVEADLVAGDAQPQEVAVDALELGDQRADVEPARRDLAARQPLRLAVMNAVVCECEQMPQMRSIR